MTIVHHFQWDFHLQSFQFQIYCKKRKKKKKKKKLIKLVVASKRNINLFMSQIWRPTEPFKRRLHDPINGRIVEYSSGKKSKGMLVSGSPSFLFHLIFFSFFPTESSSKRMFEFPQKKELVAFCRVQHKFCLLIQKHQLYTRPACIVVGRSLRVPLYIFTRISSCFHFNGVSRV